MNGSAQIVLVIPCFNESARIGPFLKALSAAFPSDSNIAIQVVDDGSAKIEQAKLKVIVENFASENHAFLDVILLERNAGKGGAVYAGWAAHPTAKWLAFADADGACSADECKRLIVHATSKTQPSDAYLASRVKMLGRTVHRKLHRHLMGRVFATFVSNLLHLEAYDTQCGLKIVAGTAWRSVKEILSVRRYSFDVQLVLALSDAGYKLEEVPVDWTEKPGGKVSMIRDPFRMFLELLAIRSHRQSQLWTNSTECLRMRKSQLCESGKSGEIR